MSLIDAMQRFLFHIPSLTVQQNQVLQFRHAGFKVSEIALLTGRDKNEVQQDWESTDETT